MSIKFITETTVKFVAIFILVELTYNPVSARSVDLKMREHSAPKLSSMYKMMLEQVAEIEGETRPYGHMVRNPSNSLADRDFHHEKRESLIRDVSGQVDQDDQDNQDPSNQINQLKFLNDQEFEKSKKELLRNLLTNLLANKMETIMKDLDDKMNQKKLLELKLKEEIKEMELIRKSKISNFKNALEVLIDNYKYVKGSILNGSKVNDLNNTSESRYNSAEKIKKLLF